jgi:hypothetical protein
MGEMMFVLQGLRNNTLVAGKTTAIRLFTDPTPLAAVDQVEATILRADGSQVVHSWSKTEFVAVPKSSLGPSVVVRVPGSLLPWVGNYDLQAKLFDGAGAVLANYSLPDQIHLLPTKDLRVMVSRLWSGTPTKPGELEAARVAMTRLAALFPIRDGISVLDGDRSTGLRYNLHDDPMGPPHQDGHLCPLFATYLNRPPEVDSIDAGITYRFPNPGEGSGGNSGHVCPNQNLEFSVDVWGAPLANIFCQETAHGFGLEAPQSPHLEPNFDAHHSKDELIDQQDAELGFDSQFNQVFPVPTYDVMYPTGPDPEYPDPSHSFNSWDWEYLREQLVKLPSTGPTAPPHFITDVSPAIAGVGDTAYFFAKRLDGRVFNNRAVLGQGGQGWIEVEGDGRISFAPAAGAVGTHVFVAARGLDGNLYLNQADLGHPFGQWFSMEFTTDVAPAVTGVGDSVYFFAKSPDGRVFYNRAVLGQAGQGWIEVEGNGRFSSAPAAGAVGTHVFVAAKGLDGNLYLNQADLGHPFGQWFP